ncbi:MAG: hypothetical protein ACLQJ0_04965 [Steroidobacteraceae bacterium]|jgi:hypothetical protein
MFSLFKKRKVAPSSEDFAAILRQQRDAVCEDFKVRWIAFNNAVHFKAEVPLSEKIDAFASPIQQYYESKYPILASGTAEMFWLALFTAILESGTHPKEQVNGAIAELKGKYARAKQKSTNAL